MIHSQDLPGVREGEAPVPGAALHYRLAGPQTAAQVVVFENGWSGSFPYAAWLERALAQHVRVLSYDRAGTGYSRSTEPPTSAGMTRQLQALLGALEIRQPVVVAGHSYGGLIGALHAAQAPQLVSALVQIDPTPEFDDPLIDPSLRIVPLLGRIMQLCALLRIDGALLADFQKHLPPDAFARLTPSAAWKIRSLGGAIAEIRLLQDIRRIVGTSASAAAVPRLVISAAHLPQQPSRLKALLGQDEKERKFRAAAQAVHRRQAARGDAGRWMELPYSHVGLLAERAAAAQVAAATLAFIEGRNS